MNDQKKSSKNEEIEKQKTKRIIKIAAGLFILTLLSLPFYKPSPENNSIANEARTICQNFVLKKLKSPSSAKFPWDGKAHHLGTNKYALTSYVDSQNSFGANIRTHFKCIVNKAPEQDSWALMQLTFQ